MLLFFKSLQSCHRLTGKLIVLGFSLLAKAGVAVGSLSVCVFWLSRMGLGEVKGILAKLLAQ